MAGNNKIHPLAYVVAAIIIATRSLLVLIFYVSMVLIWFMLTSWAWDYFLTTWHNFFGW